MSATAAAPAPTPLTVGSAGRCPSCHAGGLVGDACPERVCTLRGYGFIPPGGGDGDPLLGQRCGDYLLIGVIGSGGFGRVYHALQLPVGLPAAVKLLDIGAGNADLTALKIAKFEIEAHALAQLMHPNIVRLHHYGEHRGAPFLAMELIDNGQNLWSELEARALEGRPFRLHEVQAILMQVLAALESAHERQIVHRDIKHENIMLQTVRGHGLFVKVLDFGLAKFMEDRAATSILLGTPTYMAFEQLSRGRIGPWTDLYALGVIAFELLTGMPAYGGGTVEETLALKLDPAYDPWSRVAAEGHPEALRDFFARALARRPEDRYATAAELRVGLARALGAMRAAGDRYARLPPSRLFASHGDGGRSSDTTSRTVEVLPRPVLEEVPRALPEAATPTPTDEMRAVPRATAMPRARAIAGGALAVAAVLALWLALRPRDAEPAPFVPAGASTVEVEAGPHAPPPAARSASAPASTAASLSSPHPTSAGATPPVGTSVGARPVELAAAATASASLVAVPTVQIAVHAFQRGSPPDDPARLRDEVMQVVVLGQPLVVATTEVTQGQWSLLFATRPWQALGCGVTCPVESVSWWDAVAYANALSSRDGLQRCYVTSGCRGAPGDGRYACQAVRFAGVRCNGWRLPSEAEWEFLARADGEAAPPVSAPLGAIGPVASGRASAFGLYDMLGGVREWVHDGYAPYPAINQVRDPLGSEGTGERTIRGGGFRSHASALRPAAREHATPSTRDNDLGLRVVRSVITR